jgi:hypothetical protein
MDKVEILALTLQLVEADRLLLFHITVLALVRQMKLLLLVQELIAEFLQILNQVELLLMQW